MVLFYTKNISGDKAFFDAEEATHIHHALRKSTGDNIHFVDGHGSFYEARIQDVSKKKIIAEIISKTSEAPNKYHVHMAIAPTKNLDRIEWFVEKSIELGIQEISFIQCKHSERKLIKMDRIERIAQAAMKQSMKATMPILNEMIPFEKWLDLQKSGGFIATLHDNTIPFFGAFAQNENITVCIGPEGGFRTDELELAFSHQFQAVSLGPHRLRTETAGIYAVAHIHLGKSSF